MNNSIHRISLDIHETASQFSIYAKKGDTARSLHITLQENGRPYRIAEGCSAVLTAHKPDGNYLVNDGTIEENSIFYTFTDQTAAAVGVVKCEVVLYDSQNNRITSPRFDIVVEDRVYNDEEIISSPEANALISALAKAEDVYQKSENGEFDGEKGEKGEKGDPGEPGYTPQKGIDYFTEEDKKEIVEDANSYTDEKTSWKTLLDVTLTKEQGGVSSLMLAIEDAEALANAKRIRFFTSFKATVAYAANKFWTTVNLCDIDQKKYIKAILAGYNVAGSAGQTYFAMANVDISDIGTLTGTSIYPKTFHSIEQLPNPWYDACANSNVNARHITGGYPANLIKDYQPYLEVKFATGTITFEQGTRIVLEVQ